MRKYKCTICGYIHDEATGAKWETLPVDFVCPMCRAPKPLFVLLGETAAVNNRSVQSPSAESDHVKNHKELSAEEMSAICSSLAKGCEKQRLIPEMEAFYKISDYYKSKTGAQNGKTLKDAEELLDSDLTAEHPRANIIANANSDRGALRSLVWSEKTGAMMKSLLDRFEKEGTAMLENTKIFVCDICGFIYLGDKLPEICPVCKVPNYKIIQVERR